MRLKVLSVVSALMLVAACSSTPEESAKMEGTGGQSGAGNSGSTMETKPMGPMMGSADEFVVSVGDTVRFGYDRYDLDAAAQTTLEAQAAWLKRYPGVTVTIEGHCDERGTREYNIALGDRRASAAKDYLVALGVNGNRVKTVSYGKERPVALGHNEQAWGQNRRSVSVVTGGANS
ncbi:peptidoglycan-associated lipoprotein Pal [Magnetospira sp. QH-2]|uniref:peptidoglycan-associated lipoprotein Pal n=1 Tax=Magnetospira sp. (strain QH-2) TaxID=1288970 RepID=UPI0003E8168C|nr:peptidoglycan-associated lipoprotein Pal [Magnetospira sp. QH-2]CCQ73318.1 Peptidoglycan-associated outer membrane lipoprotein [Magnetospira sp. QH-2]